MKKLDKGYFEITKKLTQNFENYMICYTNLMILTKIKFNNLNFFIFTLIKEFKIYTRFNKYN